VSRYCVFTKKRPTKGRSYCYRGIAKKKKGIGLKVTAKNKRRFLPNLCKKRLWVEGKEGKGHFVRVRLSTKALRTMSRIGMHQAVKRLQDGKNL